MCLYRLWPSSPRQTTTTTTTTTTTVLPLQLFNLIIPSASPQLHPPTPNQANPNPPPPCPPTKQLSNLIVPTAPPSQTTNPNPKKTSKTGTYDSPLERHLYALPLYLDDADSDAPPPKPQRLTSEAGMHAVKMDHAGRCVVYYSRFIACATAH